MIWSTVATGDDTCLCQNNRICYDAKTCIHDGQEKCGEDPNGNLRRFLDSCDIKEYNCLQRTAYHKTALGNCQDLPPIDEVVLSQKQNASEEDANKTNDGVDVTEVNLEAEDHHLEEEVPPESQAENNTLQKSDHERDQSGENRETPLEKVTDEKANDDAKAPSAENEGNTGNAEDAATEGNEEHPEGDSPLPTQEPGLAKVINEYWCWRAKYCENEGDPVCGRDIRLNRWRKFDNACNMYKINCRHGHAYFVMPLIKYVGGYEWDPITTQRHAEFNCFKLKSCTKGGPPVCGFDETESVLAQFKDMCTFYQVNCERRGVFMYVEENICEGQKRFEAEYRPFDWKSQYFVGDRHALKTK
ncbi:unnamed protein product [Leptosia nina]|uniref:Kazal-like domain-containing protein n=1 Tax=Leptosia nina TaxID=320188 RepID=A0AAV1J9H2_9NEOP